MVLLSDEEMRLAALQRYEILDTPPERPFDGITTLAARLFDVPYALISLIDRDRVWIKASRGDMPAEVPREGSFCAVTILSPDLTIVSDTALDPRTADSPLVREGLRFYAAAPLRTADGFSVGAICLMDSKPRHFPPERFESLRDLAAIVIDELELRVAARRIARSEDVLRRVTEGVSVATGEEYLRYLVQQLTENLGVACAFVASLDGNRCHALVVSGSDGFLDILDCPFHGMPCAAILECGSFVAVSGARERFPGAPVLAETAAESCAGVRLEDSTGRIQGVLGIIDTQPLKDAALTESLLRIVAQRAAGELERLEAERALVETERQMFQAQKLESLGVLAGGIAHDFNNLLVSVLWNASFCSRKLPDDSPLRDSLEDIETAARQAAELARQMLAYTGRTSLAMGVVDLGGVVREIGRLLAAAIPKNVALHLDLEETLPGVLADATQVRQIILNLVTNAGEAAGEEGSRIRVTTGVMHADRDYLRDTRHFGDLAEGEYAFVEIDDTGRGMEPDRLSRIFEPFFTTKFKGRGLGLSAVLGIVRGHGGALSVTSESARGTTFRLLLPVAPALPEPVSPASEENDAGPVRGTALVVDDEPTVRKASTQMLGELGYDVLCAADGWDAVPLFARHADRISLVLLDRTMPRLGGAASLREIRRLSPEVPVVMMSGYSEESDTAGEDAVFLQKPFDLADLRRRIAEAMPAASSS